MTTLFRVLRGLGALALLLLGLVGIPAALIWLGGNPLPAAVTWDGVRDALLTRDDGTILIGLITAVGWIAWLVFAISVISELVALLSGERIRLRFPGRSPAPGGRPAPLRGCHGGCSAGDPGSTGDDSSRYGRTDDRRAD
jgi:hypothetical protein